MFWTTTKDRMGTELATSTESQEVPGQSYWTKWIGTTTVIRTISEVGKSQTPTIVATRIPVAKLTPLASFLPLFPPLPEKWPNPSIHPKLPPVNATSSDGDNNVNLLA